MGEREAQRKEEVRVRLQSRSEKGTQHKCGGKDGGPGGGMRFANTQCGLASGTISLGPGGWATLHLAGFLRGFRNLASRSGT